MKMRFREDKATQVTALLLELGGGEMDIIKLVKLVYLAEREAIVCWGRPIIFDNYCSMKHGPVPSLTLNLLNSTYDTEPPKYWQAYIAERVKHTIRLKRKKAPVDQLSRAEIELIRATYAKYGHLGKWKLRDLTHRLPEWKDLDGSSLPICMDEILAAEGYSKDDIEGIESALSAETAAHALLS